MQTLARALVDYDLDLIQIIASQWDVDLDATDRAAAADELAAALARPEQVQTTWERLGEEEHKALSDLLTHDGKIPYFHFVRRYGEIRPMGPARREREKPWLTPENVTEGLYYRGLIVRAFDQTPAGAQEYFTIPSDLRDLLPRPEGSPLGEPPGYAVAPPRRLMSAHAIAPDDAATLIAYLRLRKVNAREWLSNAPVEGIDRHLRYHDQLSYRALLTHLLYQIGLIADEELLTDITTGVNRDVARPWLEAPRVHQVRSLAEAWLKSETWNDLAFTPGVEADHWPNDPRLAREAVLETLKEVPVEIWWSIDGLIEHIKQNNPDFQRPGGDYSGWYLRDAYSGEIMSGFQYWESIEGALIRFIIEGPLRWLGLARVGRGAFLLTPTGLALQGRADWPSEPDLTPRIRVDEQGVIGVPVEVSRYDRTQIARFAAWISAPPPTVGDRPDDSAYQYRLTPQAISRAAAEGVTIAQHILPFLQKLSGQSVPANVVKMLESWQNDPAEVVVEDVVIIKARDLAVYDKLRKSERINKWLGAQIGPQAHAVKREDFPALMNALRQMGILPLFEGHEKDDWP
jgi:hypothetical protein